jgi:hypothetical protein
MAVSNTAAFDTLDLAMTRGHGLMATLANIENPTEQDIAHLSANMHGAMQQAFASWQVLLADPEALPRMRAVLAHRGDL